MLVDKNAPFPNSLSVPSTASLVVRVETRAHVQEASRLAKSEGLPLLPLGDGTNIVPHDHIEAVVLVLDIKDMETSGTSLTIGAGENWDDCVRFALVHGLSGIEALSAIPGKAGAAPIQNIGAYGAEIADTLEYVEVYDREKEKFLLLDKEDCQFGYRDSLFKRNKDRFIVVSITLKLSKEPPRIPKYKDVENYFGERKNASPTLLQIREAIIEIRKNKLPDPKVVPNCGSFFKNPIVGKSAALKIKEQFPETPMFPTGEKIKIPAGFLMEKCGFKGKKMGKIEIYKNNALVLTNPNHASFAEVMQAKDQIQNAVFSKFGVMLEPEVNIIK